MKKFLSVAISAGLLCLTFFSCASLQEDVLVQTDSENSVTRETSSFEDSFIDFDSAVLTGSVVSMKEMDRFVSDVESKLSAHTEPALSARLQAFEGLVLLLERKTKKSLECYEKAKALQSGDEYVLLLNSRLQKNTSDSLKLLNEYLSFDSDNPIFLLEKGILLYKNKNYGEAVANMDNAFLIFDQKNETVDREKYGSLRANAWKFHSAGASVISSDPGAAISCERMVTLTTENTGLLDDFTLDSKITSAVLVKKLEAAGYFSAAGDIDENGFSSKEMISSDEITRTLCARFLWNVYVRETGNMKLLNAYSTRFSRRAKAESPVSDVPMNSIDFDACIGVVEKEIINLTDGLLFEGDKPVSELEFIQYVIRCEQAAK